MADGFSVHFDGARELLADLEALPAKVQREVPALVEKGAVNIKAQLREEMTLRTAKGEKRGLAESISYDMHDGGFVAEIGPRKGGPGSLANIAYFGGAHGGGGSAPDPRGALGAEAPLLEQALGDLVARILGR